MAAPRLAEVRTGLPTSLQFLEVCCSCPCLQRAAVPAVPAVLTVSHPEMALSTPEREVLTPSRHPPPLPVGRQGGLCWTGQLGVPLCSECGMGGSCVGVDRAAGQAPELLGICSKHQGHSSVQLVCAVPKDILFVLEGAVGQLKGSVLCLVLTVGF